MKHGVGGKVGWMLKGNAIDHGPLHQAEGIGNVDWLAGLSDSDHHHRSGKNNLIIDPETMHRHER